MAHMQPIRMATNLIHHQQQRTPVIVEMHHTHHQPNHGSYNMQPMTVQMTQTPVSGQPVFVSIQQPQQMQQHQQIQMQQMPVQVPVQIPGSREKTPMCLVNELARYNKIQHQYRLTDESGPAHQKTFTVTLRLDQEEYIASGPSIKKAQHAAAMVALEKTSFKHPHPKPNKRSPVSTMTPTVELNSLAMKRGELATYTFLDPPRQYPMVQPNLNFKGIYNQRYHYGRGTNYGMLYYVSLRVGNHEFFGEGHTPQLARHSAASKALKTLKDLPITEQPQQVPVQQCNELDDPELDLKSPISLVHEHALKHGMTVKFEVISETGPPHMKTFITNCIVGNLITQGNGNGKKISKKRAAEKMLLEMKNKLPPLPQINNQELVQQMKQKPNGSKKKSRNLIKEPKTNPDYGQGTINPISRLIQIQQAKKEKEPVYTLVSERGVARRREFVMQVTVNNHTCTGTGPNKKTAKKAAADALLQAMGYSKPSPQPEKSAIKQQQQQQQQQQQEGEKNKKVTFVDNTEVKDGVPSSGRQLVPGLILMADGTTVNSYGTPNPNPVSITNPANVQTTAAIANELLTTGKSPTADNLAAKSGHQVIPQPQTGPVVSAKEQLLYLASVLGFQVQFTDFPKGNRMEFLSLVSLSTNPTLVAHGSGITIDLTHNAAAHSALKQLADMALETVPIIEEAPPSSNTSQ